MIDWPSEPPVLEGHGLVLRAPRPDDADAVYRACQDAAIHRYTRVPVPYARSDAEMFVGELAPLGWQQRVAASFVAVDDTDAVLGSVGLVGVDHATGVAEAGYWVAPWARGSAVAARSMRVLATWAFSIGVARLELLIEPENTASLAVARAIGARDHGIREGVAPIRGIQRVHTAQVLEPATLR